jgi:uncharacterized protein (TIGR02996 family)
MTAQHILETLDGPRTQREKLAWIEERIDQIRGFRDDVFTEVVRRINKKLNSPKLRDPVFELVAKLHADRVSIPAPEPPPPPLPPEPAAPVPVPIDELGERLLAEIFANPDAQDAYLAYGDYLAAKGDPQGELIGIGRELAKNPGHKAMVAAHAELVPKVLGSLAELDDILVETEWYMGFIRRAKLAYSMERFNADRTPDVKLHEVLTTLLAGPGRLIQDLTIGLVRHDANWYGEIVKVIAEQPRQLRTLFLGDYHSEECELNWSGLQDLAPLWPACRELRDLTLRGGSMHVGPIDLPKLVTLSTITGNLDRESLGHIGRAAWPELVELSIQLGAEGTTDIEMLAPIFAAERVPKLRTLRIWNSNAGDTVLAHIVESKLLEQLEVLDVSMSTFENGIEPLVLHPARFQQLRQLVIGGEELEPRELPGINVVWSDRYGPVYE